MGCKGRHGKIAGKRCHHDNSAAVGLDHVWRSGPGQVERRDKISLKHCAIVMRFDLSPNTPAHNRVSKIRASLYSDFVNGYFTRAALNRPDPRLEHIDRMTSSDAGHLVLYRYPAHEFANCCFTNHKPGQPGEPIGVRSRLFYYQWQ